MSLSKRGMNGFSCEISMFIGLLLRILAKLSEVYWMIQQLKRAIIGMNSSIETLHYPSGGKYSFAFQDSMCHFAFVIVEHVDEHVNMYGIARRFVAKQHCIFKQCTSFATKQSFNVFETLSFLLSMVTLELAASTTISLQNKRTV